METLYLDYAPKGVKFYYVYKALTHPEYERYVTPFTHDERLMHVAEAKRRLQSQVPWLCDTISNDLRHAVGTAPNAEFVFDPDGKVLVARVWSEPNQLRKDLEELVGPVANPTRVEDLDMERIPPPEPVATGVLPKLQVPARLRPLVIEPDLSRAEEIPFYAKLRAEAEPEVLEKGSGKLYLGFHLDPLYEVHWNNEVAPVSFDIRTPEGVEVTPSAGKAPEVEVQADSDPREFLLEIKASDRSKPLELTVRYFACDNANTFCIPVTQSYAVHLKPDPYGGRALGRRGGGGAGRPGQMIERLMEGDRNGDGVLSLEELPERMRPRFSDLDESHDGVLDREELEKGVQRRRLMQGAGGPGDGFNMVDRMMRRDEDGDGKLSKGEVPPRMAERFDRMDSNQDGFLDQDELQAAADRMRRNMGSPGQGRPPRQDRPPGQ